MITTALAAIRRADQIFHEQIGEKSTLDHGIAQFSTSFPFSAEDNSFREVLIEDEDKLHKAFDEAEAFYASRDLRCLRWEPSMNQSLELLEPFLKERGFRRRMYDVFLLPSWPELPRLGNVRILPARAMRRVFRSLQKDERTADLEEARLGYSQFDVFVATLDGQPAGRCALLQVGEIANVRDLHVGHSFRRNKVGTSMMSYLLEMARRLMMKTICTKVDAASTPAHQFAENCGFVAQGQLVDFIRSEK